MPCCSQFSSAFIVVAAISCAFLFVLHGNARGGQWEHMIIDGKEYSYRSPNNATEAVELFNDGLQAYNFLGPVNNCDFVIQIPGGKNKSYGAVCLLHEQKAFICNDKMAGGVSVKFSQRTAITRDNVVEFTVHNCWGG